MTEHDLISRLREIGIDVCSLAEIPEGKKRWPLTTKRHNEKDGFTFRNSVADATFITYGAFGITDDHGEHWSSRSKNDFSIRDLAEIERHKKLVVDLKIQTQAETALTTDDLISQLHAASNDHEYLVRKKVDAAGLYALSLDLIAPLSQLRCEGPMKIVGYQRIRPDGTKRFAPGMEMKGSFFFIPGDQSYPILFCEGITTGKTLAAVTGNAVICAMNSGNLPVVCKLFRDAGYMGLICADNDLSHDPSKGNPGIEKATEASRITNWQVVWPVIASANIGTQTDFNDLYVHEGVESVQYSLRSFINSLANKFGSTTSPDEPSEEEYMAMVQQEIESSHTPRPGRGNPIISWQGFGPLEHPRFLIQSPPQPGTGVVGFMPEHGFCFIYGPPGAGKSWVAVDMALAIATGAGWQGNRSQTKRVLYICGEGEMGMKNRIRAWAVHKGLPEISDTHFRTTERPVHVDTPQALMELGEFLSEMSWKPEVLFIDTLASNSTYQENDTQETKIVVGLIKGFAREHGISNITIVHHSSKGDSAGLRGSSVLDGAADCEILINIPQEDNDDEQRRIHYKKMKDSPEPEDIWFDLDQVELGIPEVPDPFGDRYMITSAVIRIEEKALPSPDGGSIDLSGLGAPGSDSPSAGGIPPALSPLELEFGASPVVYEALRQGQEIHLPDGTVLKPLHFAILSMLEELGTTQFSFADKKGQLASKYNVLNTSGRVAPAELKKMLLNNKVYSDWHIQTFDDNDSGGMINPETITIYDPMTTHRGDLDI